MGLMFLAEGKLSVFFTPVLASPFFFIKKEMFKYVKF